MSVEALLAGIVDGLAPLWPLLSSKGTELAGKLGQKAVDKLGQAASNQVEKKLEALTQKFTDRLGDAPLPETLTVETLPAKEEDRQWLEEVHALTMELLPLMKGVKVTTKVKKGDNKGNVGVNTGTVNINLGPQKKKKRTP